MVLSQSQAKSLTLLVIKPKLGSKSDITGPSIPVGPTLPFRESLLLPVGLKPYNPQYEAGIRTEPPESDPTPKAEALVAI